MYISGLTYEEQLSDKRWRSKRQSILHRDDCRCQMCGQKMDESHPLDIHHRYYIYGSLAWEYNDQALITLCHDCHALVHETLPPLIYYKDGDKLVRMNFTPCSRCGGCGWLPEYDYVQGGICFRCRGLRYEELIDKKEVNISTYYSGDQEIFDMLCPNTDEEYNERLFLEARRLHLCGDSSDWNWDLALKLYKETALNGYAKSQNNLRMFYVFGLEHGIHKRKAKKDDYVLPEAGVRFLLYSAMQGTHQAQAGLAWHYTKDTGSINKALATRWDKLAKDNERFADFVEQTESCTDAEMLLETKVKLEEGLKTLPNEYVLRRCIDYLELYLKRNNIDFETDINCDLDLPF